MRYLIIYTKLPSGLLSQFTIGAIWNILNSVVSLNNVASLAITTSRLQLENTCHHPLQVSNVAVHVYPALQSMQVKLLLIKFQGL